MIQTINPAKEHTMGTTICMKDTHEASWQLAAGQVRAVPSAAQGRWLMAQAGRLWLTQRGAGPAREADVWLQPGQRHWLAPGSDWLIEAWGASAFDLLEPPAWQAAQPARPAGPAAPRATWRLGFPWLRPALSSS